MQAVDRTAQCEDTRDSYSPVTFDATGAITHSALQARDVAPKHCPSALQARKYTAAQFTEDFQHPMQPSRAARNQSGQDDGNTTKLKDHVDFSSYQQKLSDEASRWGKSSSWLACCKPNLPVPTVYPPSPFASPPPTPSIGTSVGYCTSPGDQVSASDISSSHTATRPRSPPLAPSPVPHFHVDAHQSAVASNPSRPPSPSTPVYAPETMSNSGSYTRSKRASTTHHPISVKPQETTRAHPDTDTATAMLQKLSVSVPSSQQALSTFQQSGTDRAPLLPATHTATAAPIPPPQHPSQLPADAFAFLWPPAQRARTHARGDAPEAPTSDVAAHMSVSFSHGLAPQALQDSRALLKQIHGVWSVTL